MPEGAKAVKWAPLEAAARAPEAVDGRLVGWSLPWERRANPIANPNQTEPNVPREGGGFDHAGMPASSCCSADTARAC
eukprot:scaffold5557_cov20-Phaeocystis_antarctica.AAC.1